MFRHGDITLPIMKCLKRSKIKLKNLNVYVSTCRGTRTEMADRNETRWGGKMTVLETRSDI